MTTSRRNQNNRGAMPTVTKEHEKVGDNTIMDDPPLNWPPSTIIEEQEQTISLSGTNEQIEEQVTDPNHSLEERRRVRGPTLMHSGWAEDGGILEIQVNNIGQPIEKTCFRLASNLGVLARNGHLAPLTYRDWRHVPDIGKDAMWTHFKENTNATDQMKKFMMASAGRKWKKWKADVKRQGYAKYKTNEERLKHCPTRVEESQWPRIIYYWDSDKEKDKSAMNKSIRGKLTTPHTSGRTPHAEVRNKLAKFKGQEPTRRMVYKETHVTKGKGPVNEIAAKAIQEMDELEAQNPETGVARDDIYGHVMERGRHGRVATYGLGATPTIVFGPSYKLSQDERKEIETQHQQEL